MKLVHTLRIASVVCLFLHIRVSDLKTKILKLQSWQNVSL